jgi:enoyl-CoA hydratase/carnithine racemase
MTVSVHHDTRTQGIVATVSLDLKGKINIIDGEECSHIVRTLFEESANEFLRLVIVRGEGGQAFIGGADIFTMADLNPASAETFIRDLHAVCDAIRKCPVPVIAAIEGYCLGAGLEVAAACDLRIAKKGATFGMPEVHVGIPSVIEAALLPSLIGWGRTRELVYTGALWDCDMALRTGLVERVAEPDDFTEALEDWVDGILRAGPCSIRAQKKLIQAWETMDIDDAIREGIKAFRRSYETDEPRTYMKRWIDGRKK